MSQGFSSFLDASSGNVPRAAPSPSASPQANGLGAQQGNMNGMGMGGGVGGPQQLNSGGQQTDLNYLWSVVQELSRALDENRAMTGGLVGSVQQLQSRAERDGVSPSVQQVNGELNASRTAEITTLRAKLATAERENDILENTNGQLHSLLTDYERSLEGILEKLRPYAYSHTQSIIKLHAHYNSLLDAERKQNLELRCQHADWQAGLSRVSEYAREALRERSEGEQKWIRRVAELKRENRVLRNLAGWDPPSESSDDEDADEEKRAEQGSA